MAIFGSSAHKTKRELWAENRRLRIALKSLLVESREYFESPSSDGITPKGWGSSARYMMMSQASTLIYRGWLALDNEDLPPAWGEGSYTDWLSDQD